jgi:anti-sigma regulatory factor (Ser/Thr protein kinase)
LKELKDHFDIAAQPEDGHFARRRLRIFASSLGFSGTTLDDLELAAGEAITNAILYGSPDPSGRISICADFNQRTQTMSIEIQDHGNAFDRTKTKRSVPAESTGGRGLKLMRMLVDRVYISQEDDGLLVRLIKKKNSA